MIGKCYVGADFCSWKEQDQTTVVGYQWLLPFVNENARCMVPTRHYAYFLRRRGLKEGTNRQHRGDLVPVSNGALKPGSNLDCPWSSGFLASVRLAWLGVSRHRLPRFGQGGPPVHFAAIGTSRWTVSGIRRQSCRRTARPSFCGYCTCWGPAISCVPDRSARCLICRWNPVAKQKRLMPRPA